MAVSFDRVSDIYDATRGFPPDVAEQVADHILDVVSATQHTQFFEVGVGTGRIALPIIQRGCPYTGIDISEKMMDELRHKLYGVAHQLTLLQADATALPFADNTFDVAIAVHVFHLIPNWQQALAEIRRVVKPTGILLYTHGRTSSRQSSDNGFNGSHMEFNEKWQSILAHHGFQQSEYGATEAEVLAHLHDQGAILETVTMAQWRTQQTVGELLDRYRHKMYSSCWQIPDNIFTRAIDDLIQWCHHHYDSLNTDVSHETQFKMVVARNWAAST